MALLSLVLLVMLILGLVAVPAVPRRFEDDTSGAVVELKLPSHQHWWVYWVFHPFPCSLFSLFTNYILKSCHPMLPFLFRMHLSWQKLLGQYDKPWRRLDVCSHSCSICTFQGRNPLGGLTNLLHWGVTGFRIVLNIGQFS
jgi:hypothetical protein